MPHGLIPIYEKFCKGKEMTFEEFYSIFEKSKLIENKKIKKTNIEEIYDSAKPLSKNCEGLSFDQFIHALDLVAKSIDSDIEEMKTHFDGLAGSKHNYNKKDVLHQENVQTGHHPIGPHAQTNKM